MSGNLGPELDFPIMDGQRPRYRRDSGFGISDLQGNQPMLIDGRLGTNTTGPQESGGQHNLLATAVPIS